MLTSAQSATQSQSRSSSKGVSLGVNVGVGLGGVSVSPSIGVNAQKGKSNGQSVSHANTVIDVAGALTLNVGDDATLAGAQVQAGSADVAVGGNLTVESRADTASATSSSKGGSLSLGRSAGQSGGPGATSLGLGLNAAKSDQDSVWVNGQSGIRTDGALDVTVGETTTLVGGLIGSDSGDLTLDTKSLTTSDIALKDNAMSAEGSISLNIARVDEHKTAAGQTVAADTSTSGKVQGKYANREVEGIARATIGSGTITIRDANGDGQTNTAADQAAAEQQLAAINRDLDKGIEVTSVKEEGFEAYVSDSSVRAATKAAKFFLSELAAGLAQAGEGSLASAISSGRISPEEARRQLLANCGDNRGHNNWQLFEWLVPSAHAQNHCSLLDRNGLPIQINDLADCFHFLGQYQRSLDAQLAKAPLNDQQQSAIHRQAEPLLDAYLTARQNGDVEAQTNALLALGELGGGYFARYEVDRVVASWEFVLTSNGRKPLDPIFWAGFQSGLRSGAATNLAALGSLSEVLGATGLAGVGAFLRSPAGQGVNLGANNLVKPVALSSDIKTWNQFQIATRGQFVSRTDAAKGWKLYKQANGIQTGAQRSQAGKSFFLKQLGASGKAPKWMNQYLSQGKVPPGYNVDHQVALSAGGADSPINMRLKDIATHKTRHKYYRPWE